MKNRWVSPVMCSIDYEVTFLGTGVAKNGWRGEGGEEAVNRESIEELREWERLNILMWML